MRTALGRALILAAGGMLALVALVPVGYLLAAVVGGLVPVNAGFSPDPDGIPIYVRTNGVHAELVLPTRAAGVDWSEDLPASDMRALPSALPWIAFGWGDAHFFASTPTWSDLRLGTALDALGGRGEGAMHVEYLAVPSAYAGRALRLSRSEYLRLVAYVRASFARDPAGRPRRLDVPGYFERDAFYAARPRYTFWFTSNEWVRRALADAGVRTALWAPFDVALFFQLRDL